MELIAESYGWVGDYFRSVVDAFASGLIVYLSLEVTAFLVVTTAIVTGLKVLWRHPNKFHDFRAKDLLPAWLRSPPDSCDQAARNRHLRVQGIMYVLVTASTMFSAYDLMLRIEWLVTQGWMEAPLKYKILFLFIHIGIGVFSTASHTLIDILLTDDEFCALCFRKIERGRTE